MKKVMFATDFETMTLSELKALLPLKEAGLEAVFLCHVLRLKEVAFVPYGGFLKEAQEKMEAEALARLRDWSGVVEESGVKAEAFVKVGVPWRSILSTAQDARVDLIALGTEKDDPEELDMGSTALKVVRHSEVPTLIMKKVEGSEGGIFKRGLLAVDFSLPSEKALGLAMKLSPVIEELELVHVVSEKEVRELTPQEIEPRAEQGMKALDPYVCELAHLGVKAKAHVFVGNTVREILRSAEDSGATVIIMGTTGKDMIKEFWMGSASHRVAELAKCSVLLVP